MTKTTTRIDLTKEQAPLWSERPLTTEMNIPSEYVSGQTRTAYRAGYEAAMTGKTAQLYGGKLTKEAYLAGYRAGTEEAIRLA